MRCRAQRGSVVAWVALVVGLGLGVAGAVLGATGCTPELCGRNSDCPVGQVCSATSTCATPADAAVDGAATDDAGSIPAAGSDAPPSSAAATAAAVGPR